jgi:uroporphyrinogen-III synthase
MGPSLDNLRVLILESRRAKEMASIVSSYGGQPVAAPSMREVPLESNPEALAFADALERDEFDLVILLTGVGTRALVAVVERVRGSRDSFVRALGRTKVMPRGPKPLAVLRELEVPIWLTAPEPNTWREVLSALDSQQQEFPLGGRRVAVQEYGASNPDLLAGLEARGARVTRVPVYQWALPDDLAPLQAGVRAIADGQIDVVLFTTATQVVHLLKVAESMGMASGVRAGVNACVVASIGPTTSEELREQGIEPDLEPPHPKMGFLVREAAERAAGILRRKRFPRT